MTPGQLRQHAAQRFCSVNKQDWADASVQAMRDAADQIEKMVALIAQQANMVEKCMVAMNENADRGQKAEAERDALRAKVTAPEIAA